MAKGINIDNTASPRSISLDGVEVAQGGSANSAGLYAVGGGLYLDGNKIAEGEDNNGLLIKDGDLYFGGVEVGGGDTPTPPTPPTPVETDLWIPPTQEAGSPKKFNYKTLIQAYDGLMSQSSYPGTIKKYEYSESNKQNITMYSDDGAAHTQAFTCSHAFTEVNAGTYNTYGSVLDLSFPLYHYEFIPSGGYTKTFFIQAGIHGNEKDAPQTIFRFFDIICNHASESAYSRLAALRDNVRFIVIPCVSPKGYDVEGLRVSWTDWDGDTPSSTLNLNRDYDYNHQYAISSGAGGNYPFQRCEVRHTKAVIDSIGVKNFDFMVDEHDGGDVTKHFWFNYNADGPAAPAMRKLLADIIEYEDELIANGGTDYRDKNNADADAEGWVHPNCCDESGYSTGVASLWFSFTLGAIGSVCEYLGGYFRYEFTAEQMTRSLRLRANQLIYAYELINTKGWRIHEAQNAKYFHFDYPVSMTRQTLRMDGSGGSAQHAVVTIGDVYARWDALQSANPSYITKSASLGQNVGGNEIYCYTLGNGNKKVLFLGGTMRYSIDAKDTEMGMYVLAEYLCNNYIVQQSSFLQKLKNDYTIVVLPCIDIKSGRNTSAENRVRSLNNSFSSYAKWEIVNSKCSRKGTFNDTGVFTSWIAQYTDAILLLSGGERNTDLGSPSYESNFMTQFIVPKNQTTPTWLTAYCTHLEDDRGEDEPDVENTAGLTCGDYAYDNLNIPAVFINLNVSNKWQEVEQYMLNSTSEKYMWRTYETGRRVANIVNIILMAGGDIAIGGGLINNE